MKEASVVVNLPRKTDDHPVAMLVQIASRYDSRISMADGARKVNAKSIMGMMALGLRNNIELEVSADGSDENEAVEAIVDYLKGSD